MKIVTQYIADDGTVFIDEDLCRAYESREKAKNIEMKMFDKYFIELELGEDLEDTFNDTWFLKFNKLEDKEEFVDLVDEYGLCTDGINDTDSLCLYWEDHKGIWYDLNEKINKINDYVNSCKKCGLI